MDDVVAVRFRDARYGEACIFTWGRLFDPVDPSQLVSALRRDLPRATDLRVCSSLREASGFEYFHEAVIHFAALVATQPIHNEEWLMAQRDNEALSRSIYLLGRKIDEG